MNYDSILLDLMSRVVSLEKEVTLLKQSNNTTNDDIETTGRDTTKYLLDKNKYPKNRLVLAVVKKYVQMHRDISASELMTIFDKSLQGSHGVIQTLKHVNAHCDKRRFFMNVNEIINTSTEPCVVCNQWSLTNIDNIINKARSLNIDIKIINKGELVDANTTI